MRSSAYRVLGPPGPRDEGAGVKPAPKPSLDRWGCVCKISLRSVQGFGFLLPLHTPADRQTNKNLYAHFYIYIDRAWGCWRINASKLILWKMNRAPLKMNFPFSRLNKKDEWLEILEFVKTSDLRGRRSLFDFCLAAKETKSIEMDWEGPNVHRRIFWVNY